jgi:hypothetical protein
VFQCDQANEWQDYRRLAIFALAAAAIIALVAHVAFRFHHDDRINCPFLYDHKGSPAEYGAGLKLAIDRGWLWKPRAAPM